MWNTAKLALGIAVSIVCGCFNPSFNNGVPCADQECPKGQFCAEDGRCYDNGTTLPQIDAGEPSIEGTGNIFLTQVAVVDAELVTAAKVVEGADFGIEFHEVRPSSTVVFDNNATGRFGCTVFEFTAGLEPESVDEGPIVATDFGTVGDFRCSFEAPSYSCSPFLGANGTVGPDSNIVLGGDQDAIVVVDGANFLAGGTGDSGARGMTISFPAGTWTAPVNDGTFPIRRVSSSELVVVSNPNAVADPDGPETQTAFRMVVGAGPVLDTLGAPFDVLEQTTSSFMVAGGGAENGLFDGFNHNVTPASTTSGRLVVNLANGDPFPIDELPQTEITISCGPEAGGNCVSGSPQSALVISGRTTDGALPSTGNAVIDETAMPEPVGTYTTFECIFLDQKEGTIPQGALDAIRAGNPTRIETKVFYGSGAITTEDDGDQLRVLAGYGLVGYTDL